MNAFPFVSFTNVLVAYFDTKDQYFLKLGQPDRSHVRGIDNFACNASRNDETYGN